MILATSASVGAKRATNWSAVRNRWNCGSPGVESDCNSFSASFSWGQPEGNRDRNPCCARLRRERPKIDGLGRSRGGVGQGSMRCGYHGRGLRHGVREHSQHQEYRQNSCFQSHEFFSFITDWLASSSTAVGSVAREYGARINANPFPREQMRLEERLERVSRRTQLAGCEKHPDCRRLVLSCPIGSSPGPKKPRERS
jgi:hypothetical protein